MMRMNERILQALSDGCSTSTEIAQAVGIDHRKASAWLSELGRWGLVVKSGKDQGITIEGKLSPPRNVWLLTDGVE